MGWESLCLGKSVLVFGNAWYRRFPGVTEFFEDISFEEIINNTPNKLDLNLAFDQLMKTSHDGVIDRAYTSLVKNYDKENVIDFSYKEEFFLLNQDISKKKRYIRKLKNSVKK